MRPFGFQFRLRTKLIRRPFIRAIARLRHGGLRLIFGNCK
jgi:hypothetical protein